MNLESLFISIRDFVCPYVCITQIGFVIKNDRGFVIIPPLIIVTAQLQPKTKLVWLGYWCLTHPTHHKLLDILRSWFLVCNLILTQLDEIWKTKLGVPQKEFTP